MSASDSSLAVATADPGLERIVADTGADRDPVPWLERRSVAIVLGVLGVAISLVAWELSVVSGMLPEVDIPRFSTVISEMWTLLSTNFFWTAVGQTASGGGQGLVLAMLIGIPIGLLMGVSEIVRHGLRPTVEFLRPVPGFALLPLAIVIWGPNPGSVVFLVTFACVWVLLIQTMNGAHSVDGVGLDTARAYGIGPFNRLRWVVVPGSLPYVTTGLRLCVTIALLVAIGAQVIGGSPGMGVEIRNAQTQGDLPLMYSLVLASGFLGIFLTLITEVLERRLLRWHPSQRGSR